jgi:hypothetical protein
VSPLAVAIDPSLAEPPIMARVKMTHRRIGGYYFEITDDPSVPERPVYLKVSDPETIEERLVERCR